MSESSDVAAFLALFLALLYEELQEESENTRGGDLEAMSAWVFWWETEWRSEVVECCKQKQNKPKKEKKKREKKKRKLKEKKEKRGTQTQDLFANRQSWTSVCQGGEGGKGRGVLLGTEGG